MLPTTTHNHPRLYRKRRAQRGQGSWARNACAQEIQQIITYELTCLFVVSLSSALDNCTEHDSSNCWCSLESRESPVWVQLLQNDRPRIRTNSNETEWNRTERNRTRTKLNVIERCLRTVSVRFLAEYDETKRYCIERYWKRVFDAYCNIPWVWRVLYFTGNLLLYIHILQCELFL